eukprot:Awhi_evm1s15493
MTKAASNANSQSKPKGKKFQMQEYMEKAQKMIDNYDFDLAKKFVDRALEIEPDSIHALEILAFINIELDDLESAFERVDYFNAIIIPGVIGSFHHARFVTGESSHRNLWKGYSVFIVLVDFNSNPSSFSLRGLEGCDLKGPFQKYFFSGSGSTVVVDVHSIDGTEVSSGVNVSVTIVRKCYWCGY